MFALATAQDRDDGGSVVSADFLLNAFAYGLLFVILVAAVFLVRGWLGGRRDRQPSAAWAMASLVLVRVILAWAVFAGLMTLVFPAQTSTRIPGGATRGDGVITIETTAGKMILCPFGPGPTLTPAQAATPGCRASEALSGAGSSADPSVTYGYTLRIPQPSASEKRTFWLLDFARSLGWVMGLLAIERVIRQATRRRPFAAANVLWLRVLAGAIVINGFVVVLVSTHFVDRLIRAHDPSGQYELLRRIGAETSPSVAPLGVALLVLVLAEIWRFGIRLRDDVEATV